MKVYISYSHRYHGLVEVLVKVLRDRGHAVSYLTEVRAGEDLISEIAARIRSADTLVALVESDNSNIIYEMGLAHGAGVPMLVATPQTEVLPLHASTVPYVQLTLDVHRDAREIARRLAELERRLVTKAGTDFTSAEDALLAASKNDAMLEALTPDEFARLLTSLFKERGYNVQSCDSLDNWATDFAFISQKDGSLVLVECKKLSRQSRVSIEGVRQLLAAISSNEKAVGILVSSSGFTASAIALGIGKPIVLCTLEDVLTARSESELLQSAQPAKYS